MIEWVTVKDLKINIAAHRVEDSIWYGVFFSKLISVGVNEKQYVVLEPTQLISENLYDAIRLGISCAQMISGKIMADVEVFTEDGEFDLNIDIKDMLEGM
jgi:hypothetical protein